MSVAPLDGASGPSLAEYLAEEHRMGPLAPSEVASSAFLNQPLFQAGAEGEDAGSSPTTDATTTDPSTTDTTTTDTTTTDTTTTATTTPATTTTDTTTADTTTADTTTADTTTADTTTGDGTTGDSSVGDPLIDNVDVATDTSGQTVLVGVVADDGGSGNLTLTLQDGTICQVNADGTFSVNLSNWDGSAITILATDADGNTSTYTFYSPT